MAEIRCSVCVWENENGRKVDTSMKPETWAAEVGTHRTTITRHLGHAPNLVAPSDGKGVGYSFDHDDAKGVVKIEKRADRIIPLSEWLEDLRADGFDPADYNHSVGHSVWGQNNTESGLVTLYANRFTATLKSKKDKAESLSPVVFESVLEAVRGFTFIPEPVSHAPESAVIVPADLQVGKVDGAGGTKETVEQALHSFHRFAADCRERRPQEIVIVDAGDAIENVHNTSKQLGTNDLDLPHQIAAASHVFLEGIKLLAPLAPKVRFAAVTSNHGEFRLGPKAPGGDSHSDFGIVIAEMLRSALTLNPEAFGHVTIQTPDLYMESLAFETSGSKVGVVHGHQAGSADKLGTWWSGQTHGRMPVSDSRILLAGHWHSLRVYQSGDGRWVIVGPSSDRGSTWYTNLRGEQAQSGMLAFTTSDNEWRDLRIL